MKILRTILKGLVTVIAFALLALIGMLLVIGPLFLIDDYGVYLTILYIPHVLFFLYGVGIEIK